MRRSQHSRRTAEQGEKHSLRALGRRLDKSRQLLGVWSKKHTWQSRLIELETQAIVEENARQAEAGRKAKEKVAQLIETEKLRFIQRQIRASERATEKALEILDQPMGDSRPDSAAKLLSAGNVIGSGDA